MKDVYEVLRQKELEVSRLEEEVKALRVAALFCWKTRKQKMTTADIAACGE
jgi:hypothetical protein